MLRSLPASNADKQKAKPTHADVRIEPKQPAHSVGPSRRALPRRAKTQQNPIRTRLFKG
jgi:hypothetical protein